MTDNNIFTDLPQESEQPTPERRKRGRPKGAANKNSHVPTDENREMVVMMSANGVKHKEQAQILGTNDNTLRQYYRRELDYGKTRANARVAGALFSKAMEGNVTAQIFWLKSQAGYREADRLELTGANGKSLVNLTDTDKEQRMLAVLQKAFKKEAKSNGEEAVPMRKNGASYSVQ